MSRRKKKMKIRTETKVRSWWFYQQTEGKRQKLQEIHVQTHYSARYRTCNKITVCNKGWEGNHYNTTSSFQISLAVVMPEKPSIRINYLCHKFEACMNFNEIPFQTKGQFGIAMADEINCWLKEKIARCLVDWAVAVVEFEKHSICIW